MTAVNLDEGISPPVELLPLDAEGFRTLEELVAALRANRGRGAIILKECPSP